MTVQKKEIKPYKVLKSIFLLLFLGLFTVAVTPAANAASSKKINTRVQESLASFREDDRGANEILSKAKGVLVFPHVYQAGIGLGGKYGEGALLVHGKTVNYYRLIAGSFGWQLGGQRKSVILAFMNEDVFNKFKNSEGWQVGVDAAATVVTVGKEGSINTQNLNAPVLAFIVDQKGLMYNLSLEGTKITKIKK